MNVWVASPPRAPFHLHALSKDLAGLPMNPRFRLCLHVFPRLTSVYQCLRRTFRCTVATAATAATASGSARDTPLPSGLFDEGDLCVPAAGAKAGADAEGCMPRQRSRYTTKQREEAKLGRLHMESDEFISVFVIKTYK